MAQDTCAAQPAAQPATHALHQAVSEFRELGRQRLNSEQRAAVAAVVSGGGRGTPFALFGPPGEAAAHAALLGDRWLTLHNMPRAALHCAVLPGLHLSEHCA